MRECLYSQVHTNLASVYALKGEWQDLYQGSQIKNPFANPTWNITWLEHFAKRTPYVVTVRQSDDDRLVGVGPFYQRMNMPGLISIRMIGTGFGHHLTEVPQILSAYPLSTLEDEMIFSNVLQTLGDDMRWGMVNIRLAPYQMHHTPQDLAAALHTNRYRGYNYPMGILSLPATVAEWKSNLKPNVK